MTRRPKQPPPAETPTPDADAVLQVKVWLLDISPMVWRRLLVPSSYTLRELHGVIQVAMGWEGIHLYDFELRAARYGSWELSASSPDVTLASLRLRKGGGSFTNTI
jgi:Plasmid pRiA4b ORF-3-like protein